MIYRDLFYDFVLANLAREYRYFCIIIETVNGNQEMRTSKRRSSVATVIWCGNAK